MSKPESERTVQDRLTDIYTWIREPDFVEEGEATLEWLMAWLDRRPIGDVAMVAMLMPTSPELTQHQLGTQEN
ncbi:hypothetical protein IVB34_47530 [Bradyrhizobium sp. 2]|uniref:hypothetical protein n=1 Tax=Bradyrhizobium sp. 2 TaxID=190045 RepID=UPI001FF82014|nr:hypothetical protein [Bradyrhizobium sp. 2]MCK1465744.1 hypothetical protein [Bradyrhizobium sp. 2]